MIISFVPFVSPLLTKRRVNKGTDFVKKIQLGGNKRGSKVRGWALVDDTDYEAMNALKWYLTKKGYAVRRVKKNGSREIIRMHRVLNNTPEGMYTDHINGNKLDNRRENLRSCTEAQNKMNQIVRKDNTSGAIGVARMGKKWMVQLRVGGNRLYLGLFGTREDAAKAYTEAAQRYRGEFATAISYNKRTNI